MYCNYMLNCQCNRCANFVATTAVALSGNVLTLTIPSTALCNGTVKCIKIAQSIPAGVTANTQVKIAVGSTAYNVVTPCNVNFLYADQIKANNVYCFRFGTDSQTFIYRGGWRLCKTAHQFNCIPMTTTTATSNTATAAAVAKTVK